MELKDDIRTLQSLYGCPLNKSLGSYWFSTILLVNKIHNCDNGTLVLLDEPETSLHLGARIRKNVGLRKRQRSRLCR